MRNLTPLARQLRNNLTDAERYLWHVLRQNNLGVKFRRQAPIGNYIVDFVCFDKKLVVELDGSQHIENPKDIIRDNWLKSQGFRTLRFWNNDVLKNRESVVNKILDTLTPPSPSPSRGGNRNRERNKAGGSASSGESAEASSNICKPDIIFLKK